MKNTIFLTPPIPSYKRFRPHEEAGHDFIVLKQHSKEPKYRNWRTRHHAEPPQFLMEMCGFNLGIRLSDTDLVVDVDPRNFPEGSDTLDLLCRDIGYDIWLAPRVRTRADGYHFYLKKPANLKIRESHKHYPGLEFKSKGRQVVAAGSVHPDTKRYYYVEADPLGFDDLSKAPMAPKALLDLIARPVINHDSYVEGVYLPEQLAEMLEALDPRRFRDHDGWLRLMMACHHATAGVAGQEFIEWSIRDPLYSDHAEVIRARWESLDSNGTGKVTYKTLYRILNEHGLGSRIPPVTKAEEDFEAVDPNDIKTYLED